MKETATDGPESYYFKVSLSRKSWVSYIPPTLVVLLIVATILLSTGLWISVPSTVFWFAILAYRLAVLRSYELFCDGDGVWAKSGILPWTKGYSGVKWRDLDEAVIIQSFLGWLGNAPTVKLTHRFTRSQEIRMTYCEDGARACSVINEKHAGMIQSGALS
jgi:hypothetical protein